MCLCLSARLFVLEITGIWCTLFGRDSSSSFVFMALFLFILPLYSHSVPYPLLPAVSLSNRRMITRKLEKAPIVIDFVMVDERVSSSSGAADLLAGAWLDLWGQQRLLSFTTTQMYQKSLAFLTTKWLQFIKRGANFSNSYIFYLHF